MDRKLAEGTIVTLFIQWRPARCCSSLRRFIRLPLAPVWSACWHAIVGSVAKKGFAIAAVDDGLADATAKLAYAAGALGGPPPGASWHRPALQTGIEFALAGRASSF